MSLELNVSESDFVIAELQLVTPPMAPPPPPTPLEPPPHLERQPVFITITMSAETINVLDFLSSLATFARVPVSDLTITSMTQGSLVVVVRVASGSSAQFVSTVNPSVSAATLSAALNYPVLSIRVASSGDDPTARSEVHLHGTDSSAAIVLAAGTSLSRYLPRRREQSAPHPSTVDVLFHRCPEGHQLTTAIPCLSGVVVVVVLVFGLVLFLRKRSDATRPGPRIIRHQDSRYLQSNSLRKGLEYLSGRLDDTPKVRTRMEVYSSPEDTPQHS